MWFAHTRELAALVDCEFVSFRFEQQVLIVLITLGFPNNSFTEPEYFKCVSTRALLLHLPVSSSASWQAAAARIRYIRGGFVKW